MQPLAPTSICNETLECLEIRFGTSTIQRWYYAARRAAEGAEKLDPKNAKLQELVKKIGKA